MKKFLDITGLNTLVDWIKSKFNSVEKAQYVANRSFKKYTRGKKEKEIYIIGKAMKQSPIGQKCWYYTGNYNISTFNINLVRLFLNQFTPHPHNVWENRNLLLEGFNYNIKFYSDTSKFEYDKVSGFFQLADYELNELHNTLEFTGRKLIKSRLYGAFNFAMIPSESITTGETNGHKSISFSVRMKLHKPNENSIVKSGKYKLEYSTYTNEYVKKLSSKFINHYCINITNETPIQFGTTYSDIIESSIYGRYESLYLKKRRTTIDGYTKQRRGPKFTKISNLLRTAEPGYYQLWAYYHGVITHVIDFVLTTKTWTNTPKIKPSKLKIIYQ